jgi:hypothetical protein
LLAQPVNAVRAARVRSAYGNKRCRSYRPAGGLVVFLWLVQPADTICILEAGIVKWPRAKELLIENSRPDRWDELAVDHPLLPHPQ